jgi:hypothetical protein
MDHEHAAAGLGLSARSLTLVVLKIIGILYLLYATGEAVRLLTIASSDIMEFQPFWEKARVGSATLWCPSSRWAALEEDGHQLGVGERLRPVAQQAFAGALVVGDLGDEARLAGAGWGGSASPHRASPGPARGPGAPRGWTRAATSKADPGRVSMERWRRKRLGRSTFRLFSSHRSSPRGGSNLASGPYGIRHPGGNGLTATSGRGSGSRPDPGHGPLPQTAPGPKRPAHRSWEAGSRGW